MRLEQHNATHEHRTRPSTNGSSSQNGSSPTQHTNGSAADGKGSETNGYHTNGDHSEENEGGAVAVRQDTSPFYGHDREEVTRILLQSLSDLGYHGAAKQLSSESGYELEIPSVASFRSAVLQGEWEEAETLLFGAGLHLEDGGAGEVDGGVMLMGNGHRHSPESWRRRSFASQNGSTARGLPLAEGADVTSLKFALRQQKYLELLETRDLNAALKVLRSELTPLKRDIGRLHALSSLMMCPSASDLRTQADWDGAQGTSRTTLLSDISRSISPSVMIPEHRLATLFTTVQHEQILGCRYHNTNAQPSLYTDHECSEDDFPLHTLTELRAHSDEVWFLEFSHDGSMLATAGKDGLVCVYDTVRWKIMHQFREHERNATGASDRGVCYVAFSPDDQYLISCSQNNEFVVVSVRDGRRVATADHFDYPVTTAAWLPDSQTFVIGSQSSRRPLGLYSLRSSSGSASGSGIGRNNEIYSWRDPPWDPSLKENQASSFRVTDCAVNVTGTRMVATTLDGKVMMFDLQSRNKIAEWAMEEKLTSVCFASTSWRTNPDDPLGNPAGGEDEVLINMNEGRVLVLSARTGEVLRWFEGVRQKEFVVRSCFGGAGQGIVCSGSEDSHVYIWRRETGAQVAALEAHAPGTVNAVAWHPHNPAVFASAGDDRRVKIWSSLSAIRPQSAEAGASRSSLSLGVYPSSFERR